MAGVDALAADVGLAPVGEEGDAEGLVVRRVHGGQAFMAVDRPVKCDRPGHPPRPGRRRRRRRRSPRLFSWWSRTVVVIDRSLTSPWAGWARPAWPARGRHEHLDDRAAEVHLSPDPAVLDESGRVARVDAGASGGSGARPIGASGCSPPIAARLAVVSTWTAARSTKLPGGVAKSHGSESSSAGSIVSSYGVPARRFGVDEPDVVVEPGRQRLVGGGVARSPGRRRRAA